MEEFWPKIYKSTLKFLVPQSTEEVYQLVVQEAIKLVGAKYGSIFIVKDQQPIRVYTSYEKLYETTLSKGGRTYQAFKNGVPLVLQSDEIYSKHSSLKGLGIESDVNVPLMYGHITIGMLSILSGKGTILTEHDIHALELFSPLATLAIRKAHLYEELTKALETRELFLSLAAHELKTPMTVVAAYTQLLLRAKSLEKSQEHAQKIHTELFRLQHLVQELLQLDYTKTGKLIYRMSNFDILEIVNLAIDKFKKTERNHKVIFNGKIKKRTIVYGDHEKIQQVLINVLSNAAKFSPKDSMITIAATRTDSEVIISVADKGEGISKENLKKVYRRFFRGSSNKPGMGLGLYLARRIIKKHKGTMDIQSTPKKGTTVTISLPII